MNIIVAVYSDWGIGYNGTQPVVIPEDRRRFKELTSGGVVIAGRKTFECLPAPLPDRKHIVLTRDSAFTADGVSIVRSVAGLAAEIKGFEPDKVFVIGGGEIYRLFLPFCACAYVTRIDIAPLSDTFFPDLDNTPGWSLEHRESGVWDSEFGIGSNTERGLPHCRSGDDDNGNYIRYSFDLYKNDFMEDPHV